MKAAFFKKIVVGLAFISQKACAIYSCQVASQSLSKKNILGQAWFGDQKNR
jgi:hypothetical protein